MKFSDKKKMDSELLEASKLYTESFKSIFVNGPGKDISHKINENLQPILAYSNNLYENTTDDNIDNFLEGENNRILESNNDLNSDTNKKLVNTFIKQLSIYIKQVRDIKAKYPSGEIIQHFLCVGESCNEDSSDNFKEFVKDKNEEFFVICMKRIDANGVKTVKCKKKQNTDFNSLQMGGMKKKSKKAYNKRKSILSNRKVSKKKLKNKTKKHVHFNLKI